MGRVGRLAATHTRLDGRMATAAAHVCGQNSESSAASCLTVAGTLTRLGLQQTLTPVPGSARARRCRLCSSCLERRHRRCVSAQTVLALRHGLPRSLPSEEYAAVQAMLAAAPEHAVTGQWSPGREHRASDDGAPGSLWTHNPLRPGPALPVGRDCAALHVSFPFPGPADSDSSIRSRTDPAL